MGAAKVQTPQPFADIQYKSEDEYPSLCVCCSSCEDYCTFWGNVFCPCVTTKLIAAEVGESTCCQNCWCLGNYLPLICTNNCAQGCVLTQQLRRKYGFKDRACCGGCAHCFCRPCALTQEEYLIQHGTPVEKTNGPKRQGMFKRQGM